MSDLAEFVAARLDEDEAAAKAVTFRSRFEADGHHVHSPGGLGSPPMPLADVIDAETAAHIARHDPARVLREVAVMRAILEHCARADGDSPRDRERGRWDSSNETMRILGTIWHDHPDYRPEWKP